MAAKQNDRGSIEARKHFNSSLSCSLSSCTRRREGFNKYCGFHVRKVQTLGDPRAVPMKRTDYIQEWSMAHALMKTHRDHEHITSGIKWIDDYLSKAQRTGKPPAVAIAADRHVTGERALKEMLAVHLYRSTHTGPNTLGRYPLGTALLRSFVGQPRGPQAQSRARTGTPYLKSYIPKAEREQIERALRSRFTPMLAEALAYWERAELLRNAELAAKEKEGPRSFPTLCSKCSYNARKAAEKRAARAKDIERSREQQRRWNANTKKNKQAKEVSSGETKEE